MKGSSPQQPLSFRWWRPANARPAFASEEVDLEFPRRSRFTGFKGGRPRVDGALEGLTAARGRQSGEGWLVGRASKRYAGQVDALAEILKKVEGALESGAAPGEPRGTSGATGAGKAPGRRGQGSRGGESSRGTTPALPGASRGEVLESCGPPRKSRWPTRSISSPLDRDGQKMLGGRRGWSQGLRESATYRNLRAGGYPLRAGALLRRRKRARSRSRR